MNVPTSMFGFNLHSSSTASSSNPCRPRNSIYQTTKHSFVCLVLVSTLCVILLDARRQNHSPKTDDSPRGTSDRPGSCATRQHNDPRRSATSRKIMRCVVHSGSLLLTTCVCSASRSHFTNTKGLQSPPSTSAIPRAHDAQLEAVVDVHGCCCLRRRRAAAARVRPARLRAGADTPVLGSGAARPGSLPVYFEGLAALPRGHRSGRGGVRPERIALRDEMGFPLNPHRQGIAAALSEWPGRRGAWRRGVAC